ncbi:uncharacterized protein LOC130948168 [Arachis stenosperma]|uniref:uncharacterized protein LOC130948168 n=1 Tax=Arachis stenosperma TaxID=217475 RepID=UPI0025AB8B67|nr:uncharacterized protein LOC130948168 [Arachis stenosperma]
MQRQLGDGTRTLFWDDVWMKDGRLRDRFSNLYRVAVDKARAPSVIVAFGMGMYGVGLQWRRALWSWEEQELSELQTGLAKVGIRQSEVDKLIWKHDKEERVNTKDRLVRCRILPTSEIICVICGKAPESVHHLFFTCEYAWKLWDSALRNDVVFKKEKVNISLLEQDVSCLVLAWARDRRFRRTGAKN